MYKILIVEDNAELLFMMKLALSAANVTATDDPTAVMGLVAGGRPDLILLDLMMPEMDGFEVLAAINETDGPRPLVVISSVLDQHEKRQKALRLGAAEYIVKSAQTPKQIAARLYEILDSAQ